MGCREADPGVASAHAVLGKLLAVGEYLCIIMIFKAEKKILYVLQRKRL